jgi:hypothetical protein
VRRLPEERSSIRSLEHPSFASQNLDANVYEGSKPKNDADIAFLQSKHVKYILNLRFLPLLARPEHGKKVRHDDIGPDRTSLIATLYRMYFGGLVPPQATGRPRLS